MTCAIEGCPGKIAGRGWCIKHYTRWRRHGDALWERVPSRKPNAVKMRLARASKPSHRRPVGDIACPACGKTFARSRDRWTACSRVCSNRLRADTKWPPSRPKKGAPSCIVRYYTCQSCQSLCAGNRARRACKSCAPKNGYVVRQPRPKACAQCNQLFVSKWRRLCDPCAESNKRQTHRANRRKWKVLTRGRSYRASDIYERDGWRCHLCGKVCARDEKVPHPKAATIDHLVPIAAGGADDPANVATAHFICNSKRGVGGVVQLRWAA